MRTCIIVPVYNHQDAIGQVVEQLKPFGLPCFLINDGSSVDCARVLKGLAEREESWVIYFERTQNGGKGAAVMDGLRLAMQQGYSHAIQIDADGQHQLDDLGRFMEMAEQFPGSLILGQPRFDASVPRSRNYGRQFTNLWIWINTLSFAIADGMCGFRCYPLAAVEKLLDTVSMGLRMDFDIEIVVRLNWMGVDVINIPTDVSYPLDGVSHFNMLQDNLLISRKHAQLFLGMLWRLPGLLTRRFLSREQ